MTLSSIFLKPNVAVFLTLVILFLATVARAGDLSLNPAVERAERLTSELEESAAKVVAAQGLNEAQKQNLSAVVEELDRVLDSDQNNVPALLAKARLTALEQGLRPIAIRYSRTTPSERQAEMLQQWEGYAGELDPAQQLFNRVLSVAPGNAEAHFWKARLHAITQPVLRGGLPVFLDGPFSYELQIPLAIRSAQRAVEVDPANPRYRQEYAQYLLMGERFDDAAKVVAEAKTNLGLFHQLILDFDVLPKPDGAIPSAKAALVYVNMIAGSDRIARVRAFLIPKTVAEVREFYSSRWPGFKLFQPNKKDTAMYAQYVTPSAVGWRAARSEAEIPKQTPTQGLLIFLRESSGALIYERGNNYPFANTRTYCYLWIMNYRNRL
jgi:tetratricopeptide (TPR) repeat protein